MSSNPLKLNSDKTKFLWLGTWQQLRKFDLQTMHMPSGLVIHLSSVTNNLGVTLDSHLTMDAHVDMVVNICMYQLRQLRPLRKSLSFDAASVLVHAFIVSRLDYCNSLLCSISDATLHKL